MLLFMLHFQCPTANKFFAAAFRRMMQYLGNPELLEQPPKKIAIDPALAEKQRKKEARVARKAARSGETAAEKEREMAVK